MPGRAVRGGTLIIKFIGLHQRSQMLCPGTVEANRSDAQSGGLCRIADPEAVEAGVGDPQGDGYGWSLIAVTAGDAITRAEPTVQVGFIKPLWLYQYGLQARWRQQGIGWQQRFRCLSLSPHIVMKSVYFCRLMAQVPERHAERVAGAERLIHYTASGEQRVIIRIKTLRAGSGIRLVGRHVEFT